MNCEFVITMGDTGNQRDNEPVRHRLELFLQPPDVRRVWQTEGMGTGTIGNGHQQREWKNPGRIYASAGTVQILVKIS